jgi:hypothetical protein
VVLQTIHVILPTDFLDLFVIIAICNSAITVVFLGIYSIAIDTLFTCYYEVKILFIKGYGKKYRIGRQSISHVKPNANSAQFRSGYC